MVIRLVTTLLDVVGLLGVAVGATFGAAEWIGLGPAVGIGGLVVLGGSALAARQSDGRPRGGERR